MSVIQEVLEDQQVIETTLLTGTTEKELKDSIARAVELSAELDIHRYLVNVSSASMEFPLLTIYELPEYYLELNLPRSSRIAILSSTSQRGKDRTRFFQNVCTNRGWQVHRFFYRSEALRWLCASADE